MNARHVSRIAPDLGLRHPSDRYARSGTDRECIVDAIADHRGSLALNGHGGSRFSVATSLGPNVRVAFALPPHSPRNIRPWQDAKSDQLFWDGPTASHDLEVHSGRYWGNPSSSSSVQIGQIMSSAQSSNRESLHVEPRTALGVAQHYVRDVVYGANDGV